MPSTVQRPARRRRWHLRLLAAAAVLAGLELSCRLLVGLDLVPFQRYPETVAPVFWDDLDPAFGVWHLPNAELRHATGSFDVACRTNAHGMRDPARALRSAAARRVAVLGDSFTEGFGVARGVRFTDLLEAASGVEHLNFGTSGDFGPVQEWLLYRDLASRFDHTEVMLFTLPFNDAADLDPALLPSGRYRPFLRRGAAGELEVWYPRAFEERRRETRRVSEVFRNALANRSYLVNTLRWALRRVRSASEVAAATPPGASYDRFDPGALEQLLHCYERVAELAGERPLHVFLIPDRGDVDRALAGGPAPALPAAIAEFAAARATVWFTDLLPAFVADARVHGRTADDYVLRGDGHWNELGHAVAARAIAAAVAAR